MRRTRFSRRRNRNRKGHKGTYRKRFRRAIQNPDRITTGKFYNEPGIIPDRLRVRMMYNDIIQVNTIGTSESVYRFCTNDIYDPNLSSTGTSVTGFSQLASLYRNWRVIASSIDIYLNNFDPVDGVYMTVVPLPQQGLPGYVYNAYQRLPYAKQVVLGCQTGHDVSHLRNYVNNKKLTGNSGYMLDDSFQGGTASDASVSPLRRLQWLIATSTASGSGLLSFSMNVKLNYYVEWFNRTPPNYTAGEGDMDTSIPPEEITTYTDQAN